MVEDQSQRAAGASVAEQFAPVPWREAMASELVVMLAHPFAAFER
jgi:hypothetical protein